MAMKSGLPRSFLQWWLTLVAAGGALGLIGLRALEALPGILSSLTISGCSPCRV
jgi:hypothetical protein